LQSSGFDLVLLSFLRPPGALQAETILSLVKEEVGRLEGQKWKRSIERVRASRRLYFFSNTHF
jgi:hypothetical protein